MNQTRKKILYLITKSNWGGAQAYVFDLATNLNPEEFEVVVALGGTGPLYEELRKKKIRTIPLHNLERDISIFKEFRATTELWNIIQSEKPDVLHINSSKAGGLGAFIGRILGIPHIIFTAHGWAFNEDRPQRQKIVIRFLHWLTVMLSHTTITVSETLKEQLSLPFVHKKMRTIYNGKKIGEFFSREYGRSFFSRFAKLPPEYAEDFWSVTIGELHPIKQHDYTIRAIGEMVKAHPNVRHFIIGDGEERKNLESLIQALDLQNNVFLLGHLPEASRYLQAFDLFVLSSRSEALAYVIIEACIAGLPIIASNVGGIPEIITHNRDGLLFPSEDTDALTEKYLQLYTDKNRREGLSRNALERSDNFSLEKMIAETVQLYTKH